MAKKSSFFIKNYSTSIEVPIPKALTAVPKKDYENFFTSLRDKTKDNNEKFLYDRCRALIKWATACGGMVRGIENYEERMKNYLICEFKFYNFDSLQIFIRDLEVCVNKAIDVKI